MKLTVLQLNIWRGEVMDNLVDFIKQENPDLMTLQEVYDGKDETIPKGYRGLSYLKEAFPEYHSAYGAQLGDATQYGIIEEGNAIFSKFPITFFKRHFFDIPYKTFDNHAKIRFDDNPQGFLEAKIDASGITLHVFSIHGIWGFDGKDNGRRLKMADTLVSALGDYENVIMAGDFNMDAETESIKKIEQSLKSVFGTTLVRTFNLKYKKSPGFATAAVDMMFISEGITILKKSCPDVDVSDHLPLTATLEIQPIVEK